jgi:hypothetical protein
MKTRIVLNRKIIFIFVFIVLSFNCSCDKNDNKEIKYCFDAKVIGKGIDCGDTFLIDLKNLTDNSGLENSIYYAFELPSEFKVVNIEIQLNCRLPNENEDVACTTLGASHPHLIVTECDYLKK